MAVTDQNASAAQVDSLNTEQLEVAIQERDRPLIVDFYANWCGPCVLLAKELEQARPCALVCAQHTVRDCVPGRSVKACGGLCRLAFTVCACGAHGSGAAAGLMLRACEEYFSVRAELLVLEVSG